LRKAQRQSSQKEDKEEDQEKEGRKKRWEENRDGWGPACRWGAESKQGQEGGVVSKRVRVQLTLAAVVVAALVSATGASAQSSWWHVRSVVRPGYLHAGVARSEVQKLTVNATKGDVLIANPENPVGTITVLPYNAGTAELQEDLRKTVYAGQAVVVTGSPGAYVITFPLGRPEPQLVAVADADELAEVFGGEALEGEVNGEVVSESQPDGEIVVTATDLGDASIDGEAPGVNIVDALPEGLQAVSIKGLSGEGAAVGAPKNFGAVECVLSSLACTYAGKLPAYAQIEVTIGVVVKQGAASGEDNHASVTGGEAPPVSIARPVTINQAQTPFGVEEYDLVPEEEGGTVANQAGSHPFQLTTTLALNGAIETYHYISEEGEPIAPKLVGPAKMAKDLSFNLPPGLVGNPTPFPRCTLAQFLKENGKNPSECPAQAAVGVAVVTATLPTLQDFGILTFTVPLFNLEPAAGEPARFGFLLPGSPVILDTSVRTGGDYGVTVHVNNISQTAGFISNEVTFWGVPGDPRHDGQRGWSCLEESFGEHPSEPCKPLGASQTPPLLVLPTACTGPLPTTVEADSWAQEGVFGSFASREPMSAMVGCNRLPFSPSIKVTPDGQAGSTPTGLTVDEHVPQASALNPTGLSESAVKGLSVTLPEGVALNPAAADGLQACSQSEMGLQSPEPSACPDASKVASVKIKTPLLPNALEGYAYLAAQNANPFGSLVALYIYAEDPASGVRAKATGEVLENPVTGQLTAHFEGDPVFENDPRYAGEPTAQFLPELSFEDIEVHFYGGDRAPLATPVGCGTYTTTGSFAPWSENGESISSSKFQIVSGPNGTGCDNPPPFAPALTAGTTSIQAGGFSPFTMTMSRADGQQNLQSIQLKMPLGLSGMLSTVKLCGEAQANAGTCGPESEIGETIVSVGVGGDPFTVTGGKVYITGPYEGAPFGLSIVNPAKAGPFDLGKVVVRAKIEVDSVTAGLTITTDTTGPYKIPTIIDGIPLQIRHVNVTINRPGFTFNPTNCNPLAITGTLGSAEGSSSSLSVPFQVTNCAVLAFKPKLTASTSGKASRADGASLTVKLAYPAGPYDANISKVKVDLPKALPSRLPTLQKACLASVFEANPAGCPAASIVGHATATTPVLPVPLSGPAYFVSHGNQEFPSLIVVLQGYGVTVHLVGSTFISTAGVTSSTFKTVPDVPVGTFELTLPQGPYSALAANVNLCKQKSLAMPTEFIGQNGAEIHTTTKIAVVSCPKAKNTTHRHKPKGRKKKARHGKSARGKKDHTGSK
jgi:hypothetical protein